MVPTTFWVLPVTIREKMIMWNTHCLYDYLQILQLTPYFHSDFIGKRKLCDHIWNQETEKCYLIMYPEWRKALVVLLTILIPFTLIPEQLHKFFMFLFFSLLTKIIWKITNSHMEHFVDPKNVEKDDFKNRIKLHFPSSPPHVC